MSGSANGVLVTLLNAVVATGASREISPTNNQISFQVTIATTATVTLQASLDGTNWSTIGTALTASGLVSFDAPYKFVRANCTAWTSGAVTCKCFY